MIVAILIRERQRLTRENTGLQTRRGELDKQLIEEQRQYEQQLAEERMRLFTAFRRREAPQYPEGEDPILAGSPVRFEGITPENRDRVMRDAVRAEYTRRHPGVNTTGLTFGVSNVEDGYVSTIPGESVELTFGDGTPRPVRNLIREPGIRFNGRVLRNDEEVQVFEGIIALGPCGNPFRFGGRWLENVLFEPRESGIQPHTQPDWERIAARRPDRHVTLHSVDGQVVATVEGEPVLTADFFELQADGKGVRLEDGEVLVGRDAVLVPHRHMVASSR